MRVAIFDSVVDADARYLLIKHKLGGESFKSELSKGGVDVVPKIGMLCMDQIFYVLVSVKGDHFYVIQDFSFMKRGG